MKILIDPTHKIKAKNGTVLGSRVCYFYDETFDVAEPLFFIDYTGDDIGFHVKDPQFYYYNDETHDIIEILEEDLSADITNPESVNPEITKALIDKLLEEKLKEYGIIINQSSANTN